MENTPGLFTCGFGTVLGDLAEIGFNAEWSVLSACAMGAPHTRERVFIMAHASSVLAEEGFWIRDEPKETLSNRYDAAAVSKLEAQWNANGSIDGISARLDHRFRLFGNAVVPQIAEWLGRQVIAIEGGTANE